MKNPNVMKNPNAREKNNQTNQSKAARKTAHFAKIPRKVIRDKEIKAATEYIYSVLVDMANYTTHILEAKISAIAAVAQKSTRTIQRHIAILVELGLVVRIMRKDPRAPKLNMPSLFYIRGDEADRYFEAEDDDNDTMQKMSRPCDKNVIQEYNREIQKESLESNLTGENEGSETESITAEPFVSPATSANTEETEKPKPSIKAGIYDLSGLPEAMQAIAEHLLMKTNRPALRDSERKILKELDRHHTTARLLKEIDRCCEFFMREGRDIQQLTFNYIGKILANQDSRYSATKATSGNASGEISTPENDSAQETLPDIAAPIMPVKEAEQIISEYTPAAKENEGIPAALEELYDKISDAELENEGEFIESLPKNEEGLPDLDKAETNENGFIKIPPITMEQYLRLKFPEAEEEELQTDKVQDKRGLEEALRIDRTCALCRPRDGSCKLSRNAEPPKGGRPIVILKNKRLQVGYTTCIHCKHKKSKPDPEFESRIKRSGLSESQSKQTFANYEHEGMPAEIVSAKARAILAAKNGTSLILAGKVGTGKSHLAAAIAVETMRTGRQALFISMPELLNEMRKSYQNHEFFSVRQKFYNAPCLVLDDWGKEKSTEKGEEYLFQIIDYRYRHGMQTIITTNAKNLTKLCGRCKAEHVLPIVSRVLEHGEWVTIDRGEDYRMSRKS